MDARGLALRLRPYGINPRDIRWRTEAGESVSKGYYRVDFEGDVDEDMFSRTGLALRKALRIAATSLPRTPFYQGRSGRSGRSG